MQASTVCRPRGVCAITGASGYVGSRIAYRLADAGWEVRSLCRSEPAIESARLSHVRFDLAAGPTPGMLAGADVLVHAGYDFGQTRWEEISRVNIDGSRRLLEAARNAGVERIVYVSTVAAFPGARSMYGRAKLATEQIALELGAVVIRCGLVWGPHGGAMFGALQRAIEHLPVVPLVAPPNLGIALVYEDDLTALLERLLERWPAESGPQGSGRLLVAAAPNAVIFVELLRSLSPPTGIHRRFVPVPWVIVWLALRLLETLGVAPPFRSDSLLSLVNADADPFARATGPAENYGVSFRAYSAI